MRLDQLAINSVSLGSDDFEVLLPACAAAGFRQVEFRLTTLRGWLTNGRQTAALAALLARHGLRCSGGFEAPVSCFAEPAQQAANHARQVANAELLAALGGGILVVGTDGPPEPTLDSLRVVGQTLRDLAERLPESVALALEFNWSPLVRSLRSADRAVAAADHPRVGILFDTAHFHCTPSKFEDLTPDVVRRIRHVHVNDLRDVPGDFCHCNRDRVLPGDGCLDLAALLGRLEDYGYRGGYSLELFNEDLWALPPAEAAATMYRSLAALCDA